MLHGKDIGRVNLSSRNGFFRNLAFLGDLDIILYSSVAVLTELGIGISFFSVLSVQHLLNIGMIIR